MEHESDEQWVMARLDAVAPRWTSAVVPGRLRPAAPPDRGWMRYGVVAGALALCVGLGVVAPVRTIAQDVWYRIAVNRIDVVRLDFSNVPLDTNIRSDGALTRVANVEEASLRAGFRPAFPPDDLMADPPTLSVTSAIEVTQRLQSAHLREALARVGATDLGVPEAWNGVQLRATIGPLVIAEYPNDVSIVQAAPIQLQVPAGVDLAHVAEIVFRAAGSSWWEARLLGQAYGSSPAWLVEVPEDEHAVVEAMSLPDGTPCIVIDEFGDDGRMKSTVLLSGPGRIVAVSSPSRATSVELARAIGR